MVSYTTLNHEEIAGSDRAVVTSHSVFQWLSNYTYEPIRQLHILTLRLRPKGFGQRPDIAAAKLLLVKPAACDSFARPVYVDKHE